MNDMLVESFDAFISYRHDTGFYMAQIIYDKLDQNGYSVFMDKHLHRGEYEQQIKSAVEKSRNFIIVLFPGDLDNSDNPENWLRKESEWAIRSHNINIIPVFCENFASAEIKVELPDCLSKVLGCQAVYVHKDYSLDRDLDQLCEFLHNVNPDRSHMNTVEFFRHNLQNELHLSVKSVDLAFHGGAAWLGHGERRDIFDEILKRQISVRVLINTPEAARSVSKHMHDNNAPYISFEDLQRYWGNCASAHPGLLEVRACPIPLLHVYHSIKFDKAEYDRMRIRYYVYHSFNLDRNFEHELSALSKYYKTYQKEFEFLWEKSKPL